MKFRHLSIFFLSLFALTLAGLSGLTAQPVNAETTKEWAIYLPVIFTSGTASGDTPEETLAELMRNHPDQQRPYLVQDPILTRVAEDKAMDMATREYFSHTDPEGIGPNYLVEQAGYSLPDWYSQERDSNNIESIGGGYSSADDLFENLLTSEMHRRHLLGEGYMYGQQVDYGIGFVEVSGSDYTFYWVIITATH